MKIRIQGNTIRFRLKQPEVNKLKQEGKIMEITEFGPGPNDQLCFSLEVSSEPELFVQFEVNTTTIRIPRNLAEKWTSTDLVGFEGKVDTGKGRVINVLVEKDFVCLDDPAQDNEGAYPNPKAAC